MQYTDIAEKNEVTWLGLVCLPVNLPRHLILRPILFSFLRFAKAFWIMPTPFDHFAPRYPKNSVTPKSSSTSHVKKRVFVFSLFLFFRWLCSARKPLPGMCILLINRENQLSSFILFFLKPKRNQDKMIHNFLVGRGKKPAWNKMEYVELMLYLLSVEGHFNQRQRVRRQKQRERRNERKLSFVTKDKARKKIIRMSK